MAKLASKFNVMRGWHGTGVGAGIDRCHVPATGVTLASGMVITPAVDGTMNLATTPDRSVAAGKPVWVVVEGNDDFSGAYVGKVNAVRENMELRLDPANFVAGAAYVPSARLTFRAGQFDLAVDKDQIIGEVLTDDRSVDGTITVLYTGGTDRMF
jgi:hypothetical protein